VTSTVGSTVNVGSGVTSLWVQRKCGFWSDLNSRLYGQCWLGSNLTSGFNRQRRFRGNLNSRLNRKCWLGSNLTSGFNRQRRFRVTSTVGSTVNVGSGVTSKVGPTVKVGSG
jgi:hypothetical protein